MGYVDLLYVFEKLKMSFNTKMDALYKFFNSNIENYNNLFDY